MQHDVCMLRSRRGLSSFCHVSTVRTLMSFKNAASVWESIIITQAGVSMSRSMTRAMTLTSNNIRVRLQCMTAITRVRHMKLVHVLHLRCISRFTGTMQQRELKYTLLYRFIISSGTKYPCNSSSFGIPCLWLFCSVLSLSQIKQLWYSPLYEKGPYYLSIRASHIRGEFRNSCQLLQFSH